MEPTIPRPARPHRRPAFLPTSPETAGRARLRPAPPERHRPRPSGPRRGSPKDPSTTSASKLRYASATSSESTSLSPAMAHVAHDASTSTPPRRGGVRGGVGVGAVHRTCDVLRSRGQSPRNPWPDRSAWRGDFPGRRPVEPTIPPPARPPPMHRRPRHPSLVRGGGGRARLRPAPPARHHPRPSGPRRGSPKDPSTTSASKLSSGSSPHLDSTVPRHRTRSVSASTTSRVQPSEVR